MHSGLRYRCKVQKRKQKRGNFADSAGKNYQLILSSLDHGFNRSGLPLKVFFFFLSSGHVTESARDPWGFFVSSLNLRVVVALKKKRLARGKFWEILRKLTLGCSWAISAFTRSSHLAMNSAFSAWVPLNGGFSWITWAFDEVSRHTNRYTGSPSLPTKRS